MSSSFFLVSLGAICALATFAVIRYRRREKNLGCGWQPVDLRSLARLLSTEDDEYLTASLPLFTLLRLRVKRAIAAGEYLALLRANCRHAIAVANLSPEEASNLLDAATALRLEVAKLQWRVWLGVLMPINADVQRLFALTRPFADTSKLGTMSI